MPVYRDQLGRDVELQSSPKLIVSLVPSQTELLADLELDERVIGITRFCVHPRDWFLTKARVGGTKNIDPSRVLALKPDVIIANKEENDQADIEALQDHCPVWVSDVRDIPTAFEMIKVIGTMTERTEQAEQLVDRISAARADLLPLKAERTVLYLIWKDPIMVAGSGTYIDSMLREMGLSNIAPDSRYPELTEERLQELCPDVVLYSSEPYPFKQDHVLAFSKLLPDADHLLVDGEAFSWYGSRMLHAVDHIASTLDKLRG